MHGSLFHSVCHAFVDQLTGGDDDVVCGRVDDVLCRNTAQDTFPQSRDNFAIVHRRFSGDGTWDKIHSVLLAHADAAGLIDWEVSVDSTINRAHQHATNLPRDTGGPDELHESAHRAA